MEYRFAPEIRVPGDEGIISLQIVTFGGEDDYGTEWMPGVFTDFLNRDRSTFFYSHNGGLELRHVIGHGGTWHENDLGYVVDFQLDDFESVPSARQVYAQAKSGTLRWASVGFERKEWRTRQDLIKAGVIEPNERPNLQEQMVRADLPHVAILPEPGAVMGAGVLAVRQAPIVVRASGVVPVTFAHDLAAQLSTGTIDLEEALHRLKARAQEAPPEPEEPPAETPETPSGEPETPPEKPESPEDPREVGPSMEEMEAVEAEALVAAGMVGRSRLMPPFVSAGER